MVQLREKDLPGGTLLELATSIKQAIAGRALLVINERADVALAVGADGVQLGEDALPLAEARKVVGLGTLIGRSVHSEGAAVQAGIGGADFLVVGTMYATRSHPGASPAGPPLMERIARSPTLQAAPLPLIGIGGITAENAGWIIQAGGSGVAVITSLLASEDPAEEARKLKQAMLHRHGGGPQLIAKGVSGGFVRGEPAAT